MCACAGGKRVRQAGVCWPTSQFGSTCYDLSLVLSRCLTGIPTYLKSAY